MPERADSPPAGASTDRRTFLKGAGVLGAASLSGCLGRATVSPGDGGRVSVSVDADRASMSEWTVDDRIFGKFIEHNGRDAYPGIYSDHLSNGSFEVWNASGGRDSVIFRDTPEYDGIAYPWEPLDDGAVGVESDFTRVEGGVHGRTAEPDIASGEEIGGGNMPRPRGIESPRYQRIEVDDRNGITQRTALPDHRTLEYVAKFTVRGECPDDGFIVRLDDPDGTVLAERTVPVTTEWTRHEVRLELDRESTERYDSCPLCTGGEGTVDTPFGEYGLTFVAEGANYVDLDFAMLQSGDAVDGKFNPTTIELLQEFNVTTIRWPGGNFASQYHWRDGVGPLEDRPVVPNLNWGGLERNYLGTNEFLEFCELADVEPLFTVGSWVHIGAEEAAEWVEYVNGSTDTEMGALRAEHGYEEPWGVTAWQVGNESYGPYQIGYQGSAEAFADRYVEYYEAMTAVDSSIEIDAAGIDPYYTDFDDGDHGSVLSRRFCEPPRWNTILMDRAGDALEGLDIHRYTRGIVNGGARQSWLDANDEDPVGYNEVLVNYPTEYQDLLMGEGPPDDPPVNCGGHEYTTDNEFEDLSERSLLDQARELGIDDLRVNVGEWNLQPNVATGWPRADYPTMAHAAYMASTHFRFMDMGNLVRLSYMRDNTLFWRPYPIDLRPVNPGNYAQRTYAEPLVESNRAWHRLPTSVDSETRTIPETGIRIYELEDVPYVDAVAIRAGDVEEERADRGAGRFGKNSVVVNATNRNLAETYTVSFDVSGWAGEKGNGRGPSVPVTRLVGAEGDPFARQSNWSYVLDEPVNGFESQEFEAEPTEDGTVEIELPPASVATLHFRVSRSGGEN